MVLFPASWDFHAQFDSFYGHSNKKIAFRMLMDKSESLRWDQQLWIRDFAMGKKKKIFDRSTYRRNGQGLKVRPPKLEKGEFLIQNFSHLITLKIQKEIKKGPIRAGTFGDLEKPSFHQKLFGKQNVLET